MAEELKPVTMKEICPACEDQFPSSANPYINELRAQLPSQGGEAVAIVCGSQVQWLPGAGKVPDRSKLYTRPADQVAEGVPVRRELLRVVVGLSDSMDEWEAREELRTLLTNT